MPTIIRSFVDSCFCWIIINNVKLSARTILGQAIRGLPRKIVFVPHVIDDQKTHIGRQEIDCIGPYMGNGICKVHHWYHHHNMGRVALPNRMNFRKNSKWPSTLPPREIILRFFYNGYGCIYARRYECQSVSVNIS